MRRLFRRTGLGSGTFVVPGTGAEADTIHGRGCRFPAAGPTTVPAESHMINGFCPDLLGIRRGTAPGHHSGDALILVSG